MKLLISENFPKKRVLKRIRFIKFNFKILRLSSNYYSLCLNKFKIMNYLLYNTIYMYFFNRNKKNILF